MQGTPDVHHQVANPVFPQPNGLVEQTAACDAAMDRFDAHAPSSQLPIPSFLRSRQLVAARLLRRLEDVHTVPRERVNPHVLQPLTPGR